MRECDDVDYQMFENGNCWVVGEEGYIQKEIE